MNLNRQGGKGERRGGRECGGNRGLRFLQGIDCSVKAIDIEFVAQPWLCCGAGVGAFEARKVSKF